MATTYNHIQLGVVDNNGDVNVLYPQNTGKDVSVSRASNSKIPSTVSNVQGLVDNIGEMAFVDKDAMVFLGESDNYEGNIMETEINDSYIGVGYTWSSKKITNTTTMMINSENVKLSDLTALHTASRTIGVDGTLTTYASSCPTTGYHWMVEYFPIVIENDVVKTAYQKWIGISALNSKVEYYRNYYNGNWGSFYQ